MGKQYEAEEEKNQIEPIDVCKHHLSENSNHGSIAENFHPPRLPLPHRDGCYHVVNGRKRDRRPSHAPEGNLGSMHGHEGIRF